VTITVLTTTFFTFLIYRIIINADIAINVKNNHCH